MSRKHNIMMGMANRHIALKSGFWHGGGSKIPQMHPIDVNVSDGSKTGTTASSILGSDDSMLGLSADMGLGVSGMNPGQGIDNLQG